MFSLINLYQWFYHNFDDTNNLIKFLLYNHYFLTIQQVFLTFLVCFYWLIKKGLLSITGLKFLLAACNTCQKSFFLDHFYHFWMPKQMINDSKSDNLNYCFLFVLLFQIYICPLNTCFMFSKKLISSFIDKGTIGTWSLVLVIIFC